MRYLHGWWYATTRFLGFQDVRIRLPGDVGGPWARARQALAAVERQADALLCELNPHLWAEYLAACEAPAALVARHAAQTSGLHRNFRLEAVSAGAYGEADLIELAIAPDWQHRRMLGAYVRGGALDGFRSGIQVWRTPALHA